jgi:hypothetical protein
VFLLRVIVFTPWQHDALASVDKAEMFCIPFPRLRLIRGFEKDAANA